MIQFHHDNIHLFQACPEHLAWWWITIIAFVAGYFSRAIQSKGKP